ncbi:MAG TPA: pyridoxal 5'-phosphate synthase glutaminase subunit PdxT [Acidimicrobiales bacterium]|jgi:5'-phosphate synthase pdxT subunit|nr:pyridoxal 5'-phosphate synthase glutaminase subunit PdxT [Acidimicrobiales bacterium]
MKRVGVLALQGDVGEHVAMLESLESEVVKVRTVEQLNAVDGLVLPGGESTTIAHLLETSGLKDALGAKIDEGLPVFGTCAGLILLSTTVLDGRRDQWSYGALTVSVRRNGYGRQIASFESALEVKGVGSVPGVFIRAPRIESYDDSVEVLATLDHGDATGEHPVFVRQNQVWGASFHPELTGDGRLHQLFLSAL